MTSPRSGDLAVGITIDLAWIGRWIGRTHRKGGHGLWMGLAGGPAA